MKRLVPAAAAALLLACTRTEQLPTIPDGAFVYRFEPTLLFYHFRDTSTSGGAQLDFELRWLADQPFSGFNCFGFSPRTPQDSIGSFVFISRGPNVGFIERRSFTVTDTTQGFLFSGNEGSHGTYVTDSSNQLRLNWADGTPGRYFDPAGTMYFAGDTLWSHVELSDLADSVHVTWQVAWTATGC